MNAQSYPPSKTPGGKPQSIPPGGVDPTTHPPVPIKRVFAPAYDWYPERFWFAVHGWTDREIVVYKRLLDHSWLEDGLPEDVGSLERLAHGEVPPCVLKKFPVAEDGKRRNCYLETVREAQIARISAKLRGAAKTNAKRWRKNPHSSPPIQIDDDSSSMPGKVDDDSSSMPGKVDNESPPPTTHPEKTHIHPGPDRPTLEEAKSVARTAGVTEVEAEAWWYARESSGWIRGTGLPVASNWRADLKTYTENVRKTPMVPPKPTRRHKSDPSPKEPGPSPAIAAKAPRPAFIVRQDIERTKAEKVRTRERGLASCHLNPETGRTVRTYTPAAEKKLARLERSLAALEAELVAAENAETKARLAAFAPDSAHS